MAFEPMSIAASSAMRGEVAKPERVGYSAHAMALVDRRRLLDSPLFARGFGAAGACARGRREPVRALLPPNRRAIGRIGALMIGLALAALGCGPGDVKAPNPTRPLAERRALEVIAKAIQDEGDRPGPGRDVKLVNGKDLHIDVGVDGHDYGVSYITTDDAQRLGDAIPPRNKKDERLRIARAGADGDTRVVILYQENYLYDDLAGEVHEQTTITAERQLTRDVQDFITHAHTQKYK
jgi:hypothetical protein